MLIILEFIDEKQKKKKYNLVSFQVASSSNLHAYETKRCNAKGLMFHALGSILLFQTNMFCEAEPNKIAFHDVKKYKKKKYKKKLDRE